MKLTLTTSQVNTILNSLGNNYIDDEPLTSSSNLKLTRLIEKIRKEYQEQKGTK